LFGLQVKMGLVNYGIMPKFPGRVHPSLYNHVICVYNDGEKDHYFDLTAKFSEFGNPLNYLAGKEVLILDHDHPRFARITSPGIEPSLEISVEGDIGNPAEARASIKVRNDLQYECMMASDDLSSDDFERYFERRVEDILLKIGISEIEFAGEYPDRIELTSKIDISGFMIPSKTRIYLPQLPFALGDKSIAERQEDTLPVYMGKPTVLNLELNLKTTGLSAESDSVFLAFDSSSYYSAAIEMEDSSTVKVSYYYRRYPEEIAGPRREQFIDFCLGLMNYRKEMFKVNGRRDEDI